MKLINADYLTGRIFTEADLTNAHTCYDSIMAIIESIESEDVLDKIRAEIAELQKEYKEYGWAYDDALEVIDKYKAESEPQESEDKNVFI